MLSASCTALASTLAVQAAPAGRATSGVKLMLVTPLAGRAGEDVVAIAPAQSRLNTPASRFTDSLKFTVRVGAALVTAPLAGITLVTVGGESVLKVLVK